MPAAIEPMKATLADRPLRGADWLFEVKWDGVRAVAFVENEEVRLQARSGLRCERQYPELAVIHHHLAARQAVLDGEIAVLDSKGVSHFHLIQPRIANSDPNTSTIWCDPLGGLLRSTCSTWMGMICAAGFEHAPRTAGTGAHTRPSVRISKAPGGRGCWKRRGKRPGRHRPHAASYYESRAAAKGSRSRSWASRSLSSRVHRTAGDRQYFERWCWEFTRWQAAWVGNVGPASTKAAGQPLRAAQALIRKPARSPSGPSPDAA
jgi:hypothetical protein